MAQHILWDASGLVKRYYDETGRETVNAVFAAVSIRQMHITPTGYAETYSILLRKHNGGILDRRTFTEATNALRTEVVEDADFGILSITDTLVFGSLSLMQAHNINSADAAILATYLQFQASSPIPCRLASADKRLLRAAQAEGLPSLNPEETAASTVAGMLTRD